MGVSAGRPPRCSADAPPQLPRAGRRPRSSAAVAQGGPRGLCARSIAPRPPTPSARPKAERRRAGNPRKPPGGSADGPAPQNRAGLRVGAAAAPRPPRPTAAAAAAAHGPHGAALPPSAARLENALLPTRSRQRPTHAEQQRLRLPATLSGARREIRQTAPFCPHLQPFMNGAKPTPLCSPLPGDRFPFTAVMGAALHCTAQLCTALHCTALYRAAQHCTALHNTALHRAAQSSTALHSTAQHCTAQHCNAQHSTAQHCTAQSSTAQHCTAL